MAVPTATRSDVSGDSELVVERANELHASSIEVVPIGLRDIFLETVKES
jgi:hypothetical protein